jgi:hypothetical protein
MVSTDHSLPEKQKAFYFQATKAAKSLKSPTKWFEICPIRFTEIESGRSTKLDGFFHLGARQIYLPERTNEKSGSV